MYKQNNRPKTFYDWESKLKNDFNYKNVQMSVKDVKKYATTLWNKYKNKFFKNFDNKVFHISTIKFVDMTKRSGPAVAFGSWISTNKSTKNKLLIFKRKLRFPTWSHNKEVIIHEVAHLLSPRVEHHGANFVAIYSILLAIEFNWSLKQIIQHANDNNIAISFTGSKYLLKMSKKIIFIQGFSGNNEGNITPENTNKLVA
jgi:hypothetical protein